MRYSQNPVAKKYAQAYINVHGDSLTYKDIEQCKLAIAFFKRQHNFISKWNLLAPRSKASTLLMAELFEHFQLPKNLESLINVLAHHKKLIIFAAVLQDLCCLYQRKHNLLEVTVSSVDYLTQEQLADCVAFVQKQTHAQVVARNVLDTTLIAGIRIQSDLFLWQHSIADRLKKLRQKVLVKG